MTTKICPGGCARKFEIPEDIDSGRFFATGVCRDCYQKWAYDHTLCFGKGMASKKNPVCVACPELSVCLTWEVTNQPVKGEQAMPKKKAAQAAAEAAPAEETVTAEAEPEASTITPDGEPEKAAKKAKPAKEAKPKKAAASTADNGAKKGPYRAGSGLAAAYDFLCGGFRTPEEVCKHVGGKWQNPDFLKTTSLLKPGPDKPWTTQEKGGKYKIIPKA